MNAESFLEARHVRGYSKDYEEILAERGISDYILTSWTRTSTGKTRWYNVIWGGMTAQEFVEFFSRNPITDAERYTMNGSMIIVHTVSPGRWIGKGGHKIKAICRLTGLNIQIRNVIWVRAQAGFVTWEKHLSLPFKKILYADFKKLLPNLSQFSVGDKGYGPRGDQGHALIFFKPEGKEKLRDLILTLLHTLCPKCRTPVDEEERKYLAACRGIPTEEQVLCRYC